MDIGAIRVAVGGLHRGDNPQPGASIVESLRLANPSSKIVGLIYGAYESGIFSETGPDIAYTIPYPTAGLEVFLSRMKEIQDESPVDWLIPTLDAEIAMLSGNEEKLAELGIKAVLPPKSAIDACSKANLAKFAETNSLKTPETEVARSVSEAVQKASKMGFPVYLKGPYYDASFVKTQESLAREGTRLADEWGTPLIIQRPVEGSEFNVMGLGDGAGGVLGTCAVRKLIVSDKGKGNGSVVVSDPKLDEITGIVMSALRWTGPFELEFVRSADTGDFYLIEINPRFPAWVGFPTSYGANFPAAWMEWVTTGTRLPLPQLAPGKFFLRHQVEVVGDMADVASLLSSGSFRAHRKP